MKIKRRSILKGLLAGGAGFATLKLRPVRAQTPALKIGLLTVKTGPLAQSGSQMSQGIETFLKEKNYTLSGLRSSS